MLKTKSKLAALFIIVAALGVAVASFPDGDTIELPYAGNGGRATAPVAQPGLIENPGPAGDRPTATGKRGDREHWVVIHVEHQAKWVKYTTNLNGTVQSDDLREGENLAIGRYVREGDLVYVNVDRIEGHGAIGCEILQDGRRVYVTPYDKGVQLSPSVLCQWTVKP